MTSYRVTFGFYNQVGPWSDVRTTSWPELAGLLTLHEVGPKEGSCIVPAIFSGDRRKKDQAQRIDLAFLDSDVGFSLQGISAAIRPHGWAAIVSSTHSHLTTETRAKREAWEKFKSQNRSHACSPERFLIIQKNYLPRVAEGARLVQETGELAIFQHQPCPKFRVVIPLLRPWQAEAYADQRRANAAWKERIAALAGALHLDHDQSCTDTSRLFYLPRRLANAPPAETAVLEGTPCDIFSLPAIAPGLFGLGSARQGASSKGTQDEAEACTFVDRETGEVVDLAVWAREHGGTFQLVNALRARRPGVFLGKVADGTKHHIRCVNESAHTNAGADAATFILNASDSSNKGFVYHCRHAHCDGRDRLFFLGELLDTGWLTVSDLHNPEFKIGGGDPLLPRIRIVPGQIARIVDEAEDALLQAELGIYQRGAFLVRTGVVSVEVSNGRRIGAQRIIEVGDHALIEAMTTAAAWERFDRREKRWLPTDAPLKVATIYRQRVGRWRLPTLAGLINAPTLREDGSILAAEGYDRTTGLLLDSQGVNFPTLRGEPTREDAIEAAAFLEDLISTFPFVDEGSRAVALSAILTACIRRSLRAAPMHAFTAPAAGSGKSMLVDLASLVACGREASVIAQGKTEEELEKRLGTLLLYGDPIIAIDNCEAPLGGEFLCSMLTQRSVRARILGRSEAPELPSDAFVTATGNNLVLVGDMTRRAVLCRLDPCHERPELRRFATDPIKAVKASRPRYLIAALTILRAYHVAGRPHLPDPVGSFEDWGWVRGSLLWVGRRDPADTVENARGLDPRLDALTAVLTQWRSVLGPRRVSTRDIVDCVTETPSTSSYGKREFRNADFREALLSIAGDSGAVNSRRLGKWICANENRIAGGFRIVRKGVLAGIMTWAVEQAEGAARAS